MPNINLSVYLGNETRIHPDALKLVADSTSTIATLKEALEDKYNIAFRQQVWLLNSNQICADSAQPFHHLRVPSGNGCFNAYVYIFSMNNVPETIPTMHHLSDKFLNELRRREDNMNHMIVNQPAPPFTWEDSRQLFYETYGWVCDLCSCANNPFYQQCQVCSNSRPKTFRLPDRGKLKASDLEIFQTLEKEDVEHKKNLENERIRRKREAESMRSFILDKDLERKYYSNYEEFVCPICNDPIPIGDGIVLRNCTHSFCKGCIIDVIENCLEVAVKCPAVHEDVRHRVCGKPLEHREIMGLLENNPVVYEERLRRESVATETQLQNLENTFHCLTIDCRNWLFYTEKVAFKCELCQVENCIACKAQHAPLKCQDYQAEQKRLGVRKEAEKKNEQYQKDIIQKGEAMKCPGCGVLTVKKGGCFFLRCHSCKMELCWGTKGPRWGPKGPGDVTGGCKCNPARPNCVPNCLGCTYE